MDRLVIESTLSDVDDILLTKSNDEAGAGASVILSFKAVNTDQIANAIISLKSLCGDGVDFVICKTFQTGIYDIEIRSNELDEPIRLMNKMLSNERLGELKDLIRSGQILGLTANVCDPGYEIRIKNTEIKDCSVKD